MPFRRPSTDEHTLILGTTGSGKSVLGLSLLSGAAITSMPYVIVDYKGDEIINAIPFRKYIDFKDAPKEPGVYIIRPEIVSDDDRVEKFLLGIHKRERTGLFIDEGYALPHNRPYRALNLLYTQGRSKRIQTITLSQRPVWMSRFAISEATHIVYLRLNNEQDQKYVKEFVPRNELWNFDNRLPPYHARWYDVKQHESFQLLPAPSGDDILELFESRLRPKRKVYF